VISDLLDTHLDRETSYIHVSEVNKFTQTYHGIDVCGRRLAAEIRELAANNPALQRLSIIGHSMGGLISRFALGELYSSDGTFVGLRAAHFISLATPHLGCEGRPGVAQIPLIAWTGAVPALGRPIGRLVGALASPFASLAFGRTGQQLFLLDRGMQGKFPLVYRLANDWPEENLFYLSALRRFETRTVYANMSSDHIVAWGNSSLREFKELAQLPRQRGKGVVREDPLEWAWAVKNSNTDRRYDSSCSVESQSQVRHPDPLCGDTSEFIEGALNRLKDLQWRRVDCCFRGAAMPLFAHQNLQVQRKWLNWEGMETVRHLTMQLVAMEKISTSNSRP